GTFSGEARLSGPRQRGPAFVSGGSETMGSLEVLRRVAVGDDRFSTPRTPPFSGSEKRSGKRVGKRTKPPGHHPDKAGRRRSHRRAGTGTPKRKHGPRRSHGGGAGPMCSGGGARESSLPVTTEVVGPI